MGVIRLLPKQVIYDNGTVPRVCEPNEGTGQSAQLLVPLYIDLATLTKYVANCK